MAKKDFRSFKPPKADRNTFRPHTETKQQFVDRVHGKVVEAESIGQLWQVYFANRYAMRSSEPLDEAGIAILKECFYAGVATMFYLMDKMSGPAEEDDDLGAARLSRLYEELQTYQRGLK